MQPWESALTGFGTSRVPTNDDSEIHITADVAKIYYRMSQNKTWLRESGWPLIRDSADFFASRVVPWHGMSQDTLPSPLPIGCLTKYTLPVSRTFYYS